MPNPLSDRAVKNATGKDWAAWVRALDALGAKKLAHREIARTLAAKHLVKSGWWAQMVAVGYEKLKGRRALGETTGGGFQIGVRKTFPVPAKKLWEGLSSPAGWKDWLGKKPAEFAVWRSGSHMRFRWTLRGWKKPSMIQVRVMPSGPKKSVVSFHQENLPDAEARAAMKKKWTTVLTRLGKHL